MYPTRTLPCEFSATIGFLWGRAPSIDLPPFPLTCPWLTAWLLLPGTLGCPKQHLSPQISTLSSSAFFPHPQRRHKTTQTALESSPALYLNSFNVYISCKRDSADTRKGGQPPEGLKFLSSPADTGDKRQKEGVAADMTQEENQDQGAWWNVKKKTNKKTKPKKIWDTGWAAHRKGL